MEKKLYLFIDVDDVLIKSAPLIQSEVEKNTNFKASTLKMLEQLKRNTLYYVDEVSKECQSAFKDKRLPNLASFPNLELCLNKYDEDNFDFYHLQEEELKRIYHNPINIAKYYLNVADSILNQFLEERDIFLETDNLAKGESKKYNYKEELNVLAKFSSLIFNNINSLLKINKFCVSEVKRISAEARSLRKINDTYIPNYGALVKMDGNDVIKNSDTYKTKSLEYMLFDKPIRDVSECLVNINAVGDIIANFNVLTSPSQAAVNYDSIYSLENVNQDAVRVVKRLMKLDFIAGTYDLSHHNGTREENCKKKILKEILPETEFIGLRFHASEHNLLRRSRNSKIDYAAGKFSLNPSEMILIDDSIENCKEWERKGGMAILYKPRTDAEKIMNKLQDFPFIRITEFDEEEIEKIINEYYYQKRYIK